MAMVLRFPDRAAARPPHQAPAARQPASIVILPCVRREAIAAAEAPSAQRHA